jgi:hypothetical protein
VIENRFTGIQKKLSGSNLNVGQIVVQVPISVAPLSYLIHYLGKQLSIESDISRGKVHQADFTRELNDRFSLTDIMKASINEIILLYRGAHALGWEVMKDAICDMLVINPNSPLQCAHIRKCAIASNDGSLFQLLDRVVTARNEEILPEISDLVVASKKRKNK